jgi:ankyrin
MNLVSALVIVSAIGQFPERSPSLRFVRAISDGDVETVKAMLAKEPQLATTKSGDSLPIDFAAHPGNLVIVDLLVAAGAELDLTWAARLGRTDRVVAILKEKAPTAQERDRALDYAAGEGHLDVVKLLLKNGGDLNSGRSHGWRLTPLSWAVAGGHFEVCKLLCERGAKTDVAAADKAHESLIHYTVAFREARFVKLLLEHGADPNAVNEYGLTPLHSAADRGHLDTVKLLVESKAAVNAATKDGATPLFFAAVQGQRAICEFLLSRGAKLDIYSACALGKTAEAKAMLKADSSLVNRKDQRLERTPLFWAARSGDPKLIELLLGKGAVVAVRAVQYSEADNAVEGPRPVHSDETAGKGETPLHVAAAAGHADVVRLLVGKGVPATDTDDWGRTPLARACRNHHRAALEVLLKSGVDLRADRRLSADLLGEALGDKNCIAQLLAAGADANGVRGNLGPVLLTALYDGDLDSAQLLLAGGAKPDLHAACLLGRLDDVKRFITERPVRVEERLPREHYHQETPLMLAARAGHLPVAEFLVSRGAKYSPLAFEYLSPLFIAAERGQVKVVEWLLAKGVPVDAAPDLGEPALFWACRASQVEVVRLLLDKKASLGPSGWSRGTPLHGIGSASLSYEEERRETPASRAERARRDVEVARLLIARGAAVDARDKYGGTTLHAAVFHGRVELAAELIAKGADVNARDNYGKTPLWRAQHWSDDEAELRSPAMVELLIKHGGRE